MLKILIFKYPPSGWSFNSFHAEIHSICEDITCYTSTPPRTYLDVLGLRSTVAFDKWVHMQPELEHLLHHLELQ